MKTKKKKELLKRKWLEPRSIRFEREKLERAKELGTIQHLSDECRKALDRLIK